MRPLTLPTGSVLACQNGKLWPPKEAWVGTEPDTIRASLGDTELARFRTWERVCGLLRMSPDKCQQCPLVIIDGVPATEAGSGSIKPPFMRRSAKRRMR